MCCLTMMNILSKKNLVKLLCCMRIWNGGVVVFYQAMFMLVKSAFLGAKYTHTLNVKAIQQQTKQPIKGWVKMNTYIIYDGRANYDIDSASVIECFQEKTENKAKLYLKRNYSGYDVVLCDVEDNIIYYNLL